MSAENDMKRNVISMSRFLNDAQFSAIQQVEAYWEALRGGRLMPKRSEIDPRGIENALEYAFILERVAPGIARVRIAGSHLNDLMGMEVRGMPVTSFFTPASRRGFSDILEQVFDTPSTADITLSGERGMTKPQLDGRMILMPLKSDLGDVSRALGCLVTKGKIGRNSRRFNMVGHEARAILAPTADAAAAPKPVLQPKISLAKEPVSGFAEAKSGFSHRTKATIVPYLRLVKTDDEAS